MKKIIPDGSPKQKTAMKMIPPMIVFILCKEESAQTDHCYISGFLVTLRPHFFRF